MYLTAQRVRSGSKSGINVFRYLHGPGLLVSTEGMLDLDAIARNPGELVDSTVELPPGGNAVLSFVDVAAPDGLSASLLAERLTAIEGHVNTTTLPKLWTSEVAPIAVRFGSNLSGESRQEYMTLVERLISHVSQAVPSPTIPYRLFLVHAGDEVQLAVEQKTLERLRNEHWAPSAKSITARMDIANDMFFYHLPFLPHAITALMGRELHELVARGGVEVVDPHGRVIWSRLPSR